MSFEHLHLLLNHFPIIGTMIGLGLFLFSFFEKNGEPMRRISLIIFAAMALLTIPAFCTGVGAAQEIATKPEVSAAFIDRHEGAAMLSLWFMIATGGLSLLGLWQCYRISRLASWNVAAILVLSLMTVGLMVRTGNTGGEISHPEFRASKDATAADGAIGSIVHVFEPTPQKFTDVMVGSKWWWAFMMDLHFIGLVLLVGTVGALDLRIIGLGKQMPIRPLHRLLPWAMAGFGINVVTGMLAFIGMPTYYAFDLAFWFKIVALLLLGANVAAFYLTGVFERIEALGAGEDTPPAAKLVAASSLFLWFAVITLGRYIQQFADSISH
jgi:uncharacterized membrane protein